MAPLGLCGAQGSGGGATPARIAGRVVDQGSRTPITGAQVILLGTRHATTSDSAGRFVHQGLPAGTYLVQVRAVGYSMTTWLVRLDKNAVVDQDFVMDPLAFAMDPLIVEGRPGLMEQRRQDFERRRREGRGVFFTEAEIQRAHVNTLSDLIRTASGVRTVCNSAGCTVRMLRSARGACVPDFVLDGFPSAYATTANLPTMGLVAMEIYRSPSETPPEFLQAGAVCGVIVIWTRSAPSP